MLIVFVYSQEYIDIVMPRLNEMVTEGLITVHDVDVIKYTHSEAAPEGGD
jgi:PII-like signaling protein